LTIYVNGDRELAMKHWTDASHHITTSTLHRMASALCSARAAKCHCSRQGRQRSQSHEFSGVREQKVAWSPTANDRYVSDRTGEDEIYIVPQDGLGPEEAITTDTKASCSSRNVARQFENRMADQELSCVRRRQSEKTVEVDAPSTERSTITIGLPIANGWHTISRSRRLFGRVLIRVGGSQNYSGHFAS